MIGSNLFELTGKVALITGATHGIGLALARGLAQAGARVVLNARNAEKLERAVATLMREGLTVSGCRFDLLNGAEVREPVAALEQEVGGIDILVNNEPVGKVLLTSEGDVFGGLTLPRHEIIDRGAFLEGTIFCISPKNLLGAFSTASTLEFSGAAPWSSLMKRCSVRCWTSTSPGCSGDAAGCPRDDRTEIGQDYQHHFGYVRGNASDRGGLYRSPGRNETANQVHDSGVGEAQHPIERHRSRVHVD
jgi:hypothetical protein